MQLKDEKGGAMKAFHVFSSAIKFLKNKLMSSIQSRVTNILPDDVFWVLTVPAIWTDAAKQFMREAAEEVSCEHVFGHVICLSVRRNHFVIDKAF